MNVMRHTPRRWLAAVGALFFLAGTAHAVTPVGEIVTYAHPPVQSTRKPLHEWLARQGPRLKFVELHGAGRLRRQLFRVLEPEVDLHAVGTFVTAFALHRNRTPRP